MKCEDKMFVLLGIVFDVVEEEFDLDYGFGVEVVV